MNKTKGYTNKMTIKDFWNRLDSISLNNTTVDHKENDGEISRYYFDVPECFAHFCLYVYNDEKDVVYLSNLKIDS